MVILKRRRVFAERSVALQHRLHEYNVSKTTILARELRRWKKRSREPSSEFSRASITETSKPTMPRRAPRIELANFLRQNEYLTRIQLEQYHLRQQMHMVLLMLRRQLQGRALMRIGKKNHTGAQRRTRKTSAQFFFSLVRYNRNFVFKNQRFMSIYILLAQRYIENRVPLPKTFIWLTEILPNSPDHIFEAHTRMTRRSFAMLLHLLETKSARFFRQKKRGRKQLPISVQLHLAIYTLGFYGNGANYESARVKFGYSVGSVVNARRRVINALASMTSEFIRVKTKYGYHSAFFAVDGTTHPFAFVPSYQQNVWYDRKSRYSMQALVTNDMDLRVRHLVVGWPGSTHDARVLSSADYMLDEKEDMYFDAQQQHGLGDAAFGLHKRVIPNYKEPLASIPENIEYNRLHSSFRIRSEHTIGHVKNRFQGLKEVRLRVTKERHVLEVVKYITAGYVLHNILLEFSDNYRPVSNRYDQAEQEIVSESAQNVGEEIDEDYADSTASEIREKVKEQVLTHAGYY